jgi:hypothetical protein
MKAAKRTDKKSVVASKMLAVVGVFALGAGTLFFQNCAEAPEIRNSSMNSGSGAVDPNKLTLLPTDVLIAAGTTQVFKITGGTMPYTWAVSPVGCGSFETSTKTFTAPAGSNVCTFTITDATNKQVRSIISVSENAVSATYSPNPAAISAQIEITPSGGTPGYSYTLVSGGGQLSGYVYRAAATAETAIVRVTDSKGKSVDLSIPVGGGGTTGGAGTTQVLRNFAATLGDFMHTRTAGEGAPTYVNQPGATLTLFAGGGSTRREITRCYNGRLHSVAVGTACGVGQEGSIGFVENARTSAATRQIFVCTSASTFLTTNSAECSAAGGGATAIGFAP